MSDLVVRDADDAYALGLWCADSYWWSSSIGLSNTEPELVLWFGRYLARILSPERVRLRVYEVAGKPADDRLLELVSRVSVRPAVKMKRTAYHVYVNSRPLVRRFFAARDRLQEVPLSLIGPYLAGRFDGDGSWGTTPRIAYTTREEAERDAQLLERAGVRRTSVLYYAKANEYCVYLHRADRPVLGADANPLVEDRSSHPVETVMASLLDPRGSKSMGGAIRRPRLLTDRVKV